ncbi:hypothetical protein D3C75_1087570 [compost metagenome]
MRRQVVAAFQGVPVVRLVLAHGAVEPGREVGAHRGVGVLVEGQRGGGVLDEHMHQSDAHLADRRAVGEDLVRHQMKAATAGFELEAVLVPHGPAPCGVEKGAGLFAEVGRWSKAAAHHRV